MKKLSTHKTKAISPADICNYLENVPEPRHTIIEKYIGMSFCDFLKNYKGFTVKYPYKDKGDWKQFLIELHEEETITTCKMVDNICVSAYSIKND